MKLLKENKSLPIVLLIATVAIIVFVLLLVCKNLKNREFITLAISSVFGVASSLIAAYLLYRTLSAQLSSHVTLETQRRHDNMQASLDRIHDIYRNYKDEIKLVCDFSDTNHCINRLKISNDPIIIDDDLLTKLRELHERIEISPDLKFLAINVNSIFDRLSGTNDDWANDIQLAIPDEYKMFASLYYLWTNQNISDRISVEFINRYLVFDKIPFLKINPKNNASSVPLDKELFDNIELEVFYEQKEKISLKCFQVLLKDFNIANVPSSRFVILKSEESVELKPLENKFKFSDLFAKQYLEEMYETIKKKFESEDKVQNLTIKCNLDAMMVIYDKEEKKDLRFKYQLNDFEIFITKETKRRTSKTENI